MTAATCRAGVDDTLADFSNFGAGTQSIDVIAPGTCLRTTAVGGGVSTASGTSMASPHVAGAAALLASQVDTALSAGDVAAIHDAIRDHGNDGWDATSDPDGTQEPLLDVSSSRFAPVIREHHEPEPPSDPATSPPDVAGLVGYLLGLLGR